VPLGVNCAFGPFELAESTRFIAENWPRLVSALPNAGCRSWSMARATFPMGPADCTKGMLRFVEEFGVQHRRRRCGTMPEHLKMLVDALQERNYRQSQTDQPLTGR